jgi:hypothetical protein
MIPLVRRLGFWSTAIGLVGVLGVLGGLVVALWPIHANGVSGNALSPSYAREIGFESYVALPEHPTAKDFAAAGLRLPAEVVSQRRHNAEAIALIGLVFGAAGLVLSRRSEPVGR